MARFRYSVGVALAANPTHWNLLPAWSAERDGWPWIYSFRWMFLYVAIAKGLADA